MKLKAGMVLKCTTSQYKCLLKGSLYTVHEDKSANGFYIKCVVHQAHGLYEEDLAQCFEIVDMRVDVEPLSETKEEIKDKPAQENKMVRYKVERVIQITQEAIIEVEMPMYIKDAYVMDQVVDEAIAYSSTAQLDIPWEHVGKQDIIRTKKTRIKDEPVEDVHKYECPKCKAEAHNQHHDECEYYGEGPK